MRQKEQRQTERADIVTERGQTDTSMTEMMSYTDRCSRNRQTEQESQPHMAHVSKWF